MQAPTWRQRKQDTGMNGTRLLTDAHLQALLAASQTGRMAVPLNNRLLALGPHVRSCQATAVVLGMQLQHTLSSVL